MFVPSFQVTLSYRPSRNNETEAANPREFVGFGDEASFCWGQNCKDVKTKRNKNDKNFKGYDEDE